MKIIHEQLSLEPFNPINIIQSRFQEFPKHWHAEIELIYVKQGTQVVELSGATYTLKEEDILLIGSGEVHSFPFQSSSSSLIIFHLGRSIFEPYSDYIFNSEFPAPIIEPTNEFYRLLGESILNIVNLRNEKVLGGELFLKAEINKLAGNIIKYVPVKQLMDNEKKKRLEQLKLLERVLIHIDQNYDQEITLEEAANISGVSIFHFSRLFKKLIGVNFIQFLNETRITKAMILLQNKEDPISEIAFKVGFNSIQTFNRWFMQINGFTPSQYRAKYE